MNQRFSDDQMADLLRALPSSQETGRWLPPERFLLEPDEGSFSAVLYLVTEASGGPEATEITALNARYATDIHREVAKVEALNEVRPDLIPDHAYGYAVVQPTGIRTAVDRYQRAHVVDADGQARHGDPRTAVWVEDGLTGLSNQLARLSDVKGNASAAFPTTTRIANDQPSTAPDSTASAWRQPDQPDTQVER